MEGNSKVTSQMQSTPSSSRDGFKYWDPGRRLASFLDHRLDSLAWAPLSGTRVVRRAENGTRRSLGFS